MLYVGIFLSSRAVASQVFSALMSLTSVFGMGTGGPSSLLIPTFVPLSFFPQRYLFGAPTVRGRKIVLWTVFQRVSLFVNTVFRMNDSFYLLLSSGYTVTYCYYTTLVVHQQGLEPGTP